MLSPSFRRYPICQPLVNGSSDEMAVDGSTAPQSFALTGLDDRILRVEKLRFLVYGKGLNIDSSEFFTFGWKAALTNGLSIKCKRKPGERDLLQPITRIGDFLMYTDDVVRLDNFSSSNDYLVASVNFGVPVDLFSASDWIRVTVQDNMTDLESLRCLVIGHVEQDS